MENAADALYAYRNAFTKGVQQHETFVRSIPRNIDALEPVLDAFNHFEAVSANAQTNNAEFEKLVNEAHASLMGIRGYLDSKSATKPRS